MQPIKNEFRIYQNYMGVLRNSQSVKFYGNLFATTKTIPL